MSLEVHVARQAVFDRTNNVVAYELLFRALPDATATTRNDELASWQVLSASFLDIGLDSLLKGRRALINVPRSMLLDDRIRSLPSDVIGLEILENVQPDAEVLAACRELRKLGYLLVLDDYTGLPEFDPLLELVDWVKVDFRAISGADSVRIARRLKERKLRMLAEKVETVEERDSALAAGYDYFQGYFLHRPRVVSGRTLNARHNTKLKLLTLLGADQFTLEKVEAAIAPDVGLCYRLIQYSNSARFGAPREISSLRQCLMRLGENETRRWMTFVLLPTLAAGRSTEIIDAALIRARMCELLAEEAGLKLAKSLAFMAGMFTLMDALLGAPMREVVQQLGLGEELASVLLGRSEGPLGALVRIVESYERASPQELEPHCRQLLLPVGVVADVYLRALQWTAEVTETGVPAK
ncbi:EAL and HDOD domain-containing protein [Paludibaculum fermentans]|uniref:HDOD domain-containing protein n=1 Tax=Paludibaculum fermentans TaxID=1473598 RepID=A0A7S7SGX4_PALFE|nr:HDOD domain-containing protein [Paludibaculum fermentans]QOY85297.1 HDOD domain-containing protein [Paludibaculum fermentans]